MVTTTKMESEVDWMLHRFAMDSLRESQQKLHQLEEVKRGVRDVQLKLRQETAELERKRHEGMARQVWLENYGDTVRMMQDMVAVSNPDVITKTYLDQVFTSLQVRDDRHRLAIALKVAKNVPSGAAVLAAASGYINACTSFSSRDLVIEYYSASAECELGSLECDNQKVDGFLYEAAVVALNHAQRLRGLGRAAECEYYSRLCCGYLDLRTRHANIVDRAVSRDQRVRCLAEAMIAHRVPVTPLNRGSTLTAQWQSTTPISAVSGSSRGHAPVADMYTPSPAFSNTSESSAEQSAMRVRTVSVAAMTCHWGAVGFHPPPSSVAPLYRAVSTQSPSCSLAGSGRSHTSHTACAATFNTFNTSFPNTARTLNFSSSEGDARLHQQPTPPPLPLNHAVSHRRTQHEALAPKAPLKPVNPPPARNHIAPSSPHLSQPPVSPTVSAAAVTPSVAKPPASDCATVHTPTMPTLSPGALSQHTPHQQPTSPCALQSSLPSLPSLPRI